ncbi:MAG: hypothetical protein AAB457_02455, partial [Patescibacteria group bacterium]
MAFSRIRRYEEKRLRMRLVLAVLGSIAILVFILVFGFKILVGFSLLVDKIRGGSPTSQNAQTLLLPPSLDPLPGATNSATLIIAGSGTPGAILILYVNEGETQKLTIPTDGRFSIPSVKILEGTNTISAKITDEKQNTSELSNVLAITSKRTPPSLELTSPSSNTTINGDTNTVSVVGKTEQDTIISINDRFAVVSADGSFRYPYQLAEGDNILKIAATDAAGNQTVIERRVTYQK